MKFTKWLYVATHLIFLSHCAAFSSLTRQTVSVSSLLNRLSTEQLPIFEFGSLMTELMESTENSQLDLDNLLWKYLSELRDAYLNEFRKRAIGSRTRDDYVIHKDRTLHECKSAMLAAIPPQSPPHWTIDVGLY